MNQALLISHGITLGLEVSNSSYDRKRALVHFRISAIKASVVIVAYVRKYPKNIAELFTLFFDQSFYFWQTIHGIDKKPNFKAFIPAQQTPEEEFNSTDLFFSGSSIGTILCFLFTLKNTNNKSWRGHREKGFTIYIPTVGANVN